MKAFLSALSLLVACGCNSTPGFRLAWEFHLPPTLNQTNTVAALPTMATTSYVVENPSPGPQMSRAYSLPPGGVERPPENMQRFRSNAEQLPMPKEGRAPAGGCCPN